MIFLGSLLAFAAAFTLIIGVLAWTRRLPGNKYIGIKVPEVRKSKEVWDTAHQFAGPLWVAAGVSFGIASAPPFSGVSWLLLITLVGTVAAIYFFGLGASIGARTASVIDSSQSTQSKDATQCCSSDPTPETQNLKSTQEQACSTEGCSGCGTQAEKKAPTIDLEALKRAAQSADRT